MADVKSGGTVHELQRERELAALIRRGGARSQPSAAAREAVRSAVQAEWQQVVAERSRSRRARWSLAAAAMVAAVAVGVLVPALQAPPAAVAAVARVTGPAQIDADSIFGRRAPAREGAVVAVGDEIQSGTGGRVALDLGGLSLRLDEQSVLAMVAPDRVELRRGALYVDAGEEGSQNASLVVATPFGDLRHLGTQYETRLVAGGLRVRVREGLVRLDERSGATADAGAGEELTLLADKVVRRASVDTAGADWAWVGDIAPRYDLENRSLDEFLAWVGRETGRKVEFASPAALAEARRIVLRGTTAGLSPERALPAVLSTTSLRVGGQGGRLLIDFRTGEGS